MNTWISKNWLNILLILLPLVAGLLLWDRLPEELPTHWNSKGEVDDTMPKAIAITLLPVTMLIVNAIFWLVPLLDPKKQLQSSGKALASIHIGTNVLLSFLGCIILIVGLGVDVNVASVVPVAVLVLYLVLGNYMGKLRPNYFIGIRTPWTLESEDVWRKTHKLAGWVWVSMSLGLLGIFWLLDSEVFLYVFLAGTGIMVLVPVMYSYLLFKTEQSESGR